MSDKVFCYQYPRPAVTADVVVLAGDRGNEHLLLIKRLFPPFQGQWALPGGFMDLDEDLDETPARELAEETGLTDISLVQLGAFGEVNRDPRHRTITVAYLAQVDSCRPVKGGDDAEQACWFPVENLPPLAFDHSKIIEKALKFVAQQRRLVQLSK